MTKRTLIGALAVALALICIGCNSANNPTSLDMPNVDAVGSGDGGTLTLSWGAVTDAKYYEITPVGGTADTTSSTSFDVTTPAATIEVRAVAGTVKSDPATIDCKVVEATATFFDYRDTTANGFGFNDDGTVVLCTLYNAGRAGLDFYADSSHAQMSLVVAQQHANGMADMIKAATGSYDAITVADPLGAYAKVKLAVMADSTYFLRMSADSVWSAADHFAKARVDSIVGEKISVTTAYQKIGGLRWLVK